jgi:Domain of unknown function (DUF4352)
MKGTLTQVMDPAQVGPYTTPTNGDRFVGAKFTIVGVSGTFSSDADLDATLIGSDGQTYSPDFSALAGCTNFNHGTYSVTPGASTTGCVAYQVPTGVHVAQIQWGGFLNSGAPASWTIG